MKDIKIRGACVHNLKDIHIDIPKNKLIVATGISGSGKSSLMFDIIFEEGRNQYLQSLGILPTIEDTHKFDSIEGIGPTISVRQNTIRQSHPRSTVGTRSGIHRLLTLLYSSEGKYKGEWIEDEQFHPGFFSYNSSSGMCLECLGKGSKYEIDLHRLISNEAMTLEDVFIQSKVTPGYLNIIRKRFIEYFNKPFLSLPQDIQDAAIYGIYENGKSSYSLMKLFESRAQKKEAISDIYKLKVCHECHGYRVSSEARHVFIQDKHIGELCTMSITELSLFLTDTLVSFEYTGYGRNLVTSILSKLDNLTHAKLGYLSLYREISSLSGGEQQRLFLNSHLENQMDSLIYVLDEPTAGLHACEKEDIIKSIQKLKELGNTVIVVEHDKKMIEKAEYVIDIGPLAGKNGGKIVYQGDLIGLLDTKNSITARYLYNQDGLLKRNNHFDKDSFIALELRNVKTHNLKNISVSIPLHAMVGIAGKSGSGKSSLITKSLLPLLRTYFKHYEGESTIDIDVGGLQGIEFISGYAEILQEPIGRNESSNPASYVGIWDKIRTLFATQEKSLGRGFNSGYFSFNSSGGCEECKGSGHKKVWLGEQLHIYKTCPKCHGKRFNEEALSIKYKAKTIHDVLEMSIDEAALFFDDQPSILHMLLILQEIGMGYIKLGQPTPTLSGGESQRIKLAKELGKRKKGNILYILDEPTMGLSQYDNAKLLKLLDRLVEKGNSVIIIEHDIEVLKACDYIIELGPVGGSEGGYLIAEGTPEDIKHNQNSVTGRYL